MTANGPANMIFPGIRMNSPFPGMDPYLERHWGDVHGRLIGYAADALTPLLPGDMAARIEENVVLDAGDDWKAIRRPDVAAVETPGPWRSAVSQGSSVTMEPIVLEFADEPLTERTIRIMDLDENRVVTVIEFLSPWNKIPGRGRDQYTRKREEILSSDANLVEIDLVRAGNWSTMMWPWKIPADNRTVYRAVVQRTKPRLSGLFYPMDLRNPLPVIEIPLRAGEQDVALDLQAQIQKVYANGRYGRTDYSQPCSPPLEGEDAKWANSLPRPGGG